MTATKNVNYTPEMTATIVADYKNGVAVEAIATATGKTVRSIVAKLSREGVYTAKAVTAKKDGVTKADLVARVAELTGADEDVVGSLEKATSVALKAVIAALEAE